MTNNQVLYNSNDLKIYISECLKDISFADKDNSSKIIENKTYCREKKRKKVSLYEYLSYLIKFIGDSSEKKDLVINSIYFIDMNLLLTDISSLKNKNICCEKRAVEKFDIIAFHLVFKSNIIRQWSSLVNSWINKKIKYENYSAFFSTLGGAYSSLGEESYDHAKNAEIISKKQLILAYEFNDQNAICRSKLFLAFSYIQLLKFREALSLISDVLKKFECEDTKNSITDKRLKIMHKACLKKLKFTISQFKEKNAYFSDRGKLRL